MSSSSQEPEACPVDLSLEQRWVVHHVLTTRADESIDEYESPPAWLFPLVEAIETDETTITYHQARQLKDLLDTYATDEDTPDRDRDIAITITDELESALEDGSVEPA